MDIITYALSKKYTDNSIAGGGAVKGKNCIVSSIDPISGGHRVTFQWTLDNGTVQTDYVDIMDGQIGPQGIQGPQGVQGPRGLQGIQGIQGAAGAKGDKGDKGDTGNTGAKGADGAAATIQIGAVSYGSVPSVENAGTSQNAVFNFTLPKGDKGDKGDKGEDGADGKSFDIKAQFPTEAALRAAHPTGNAGDAYFVGADQNPDLYVWLTDDNDWFNNGKIAGVKGDKGDKGDQGFSPVASVSKTDSTVTISIRDKVGQTTATISDGEKGADGKSAYEVAVDNGFVGTEAEWLQSLIGQQGPKGDQGDPGVQGLQGPQGNPGTTNYNDLINKPTLGSAAAKDSTDRVSPNNRGLVESQSVYSAITTAVASIYTPAGDLTCAELTSDLLIADNVGKVYELSDNGTTSDLFLQGADRPLVVGDQIGIINAGQGRILFNYMANRIDLSAFQKKDLAQTVEGATTVEGALSALSTNKVDKVSGKGLSTNDYTNADKAIVDGVTSALAAKQNTLTFDNAPTENSNNPVKSGGVYAANKELTQKTTGLVNNAFTNGAVNLLKNNATSYTESGVTFNVNSDGTVTASGTASGQVNFSIVTQIPAEWIGKSLKLSGCPIGGGSDKYEITLWDVDASIAIMRDYGNGASGIPLHPNSSVTITIRPGATLDNVIFKPMITAADIPNSDYDHYVPYAMTNKELTDMVPSDASASNKLMTMRCKVYNNASDLENAIINLPVNSHFDFCVRSSAITVGGATFFQYTSWHIYRDTNGTACIGGIGYSFSNSSCYKLEGSIIRDTELTLTIQKLVTESDLAPTQVSIVAADNNYTVRVYKSGKVVSVAFNSNKSSTWTLNQQLASKLPTPATGVYQGMIMTTDGNAVGLSVTSRGVLCVGYPNSRTGWLFGSITYMCQ